MASFAQRQSGLNFGQLPNLTEKWGLFLALGIVLILLGAVAIAFDVFTTLVTVTVLGAFLMVAGLVVLAHAVGSRAWSGFFMNLLLSLVYMVLGFVLIQNPGLGALTLTMVLATFFIASGLVRSTAALVLRFEHWGWFLVSGLVSLFLGIMVWMQWPMSGLFILGLFVGIDLILAGWSLVMLALSARTYNRWGRA